MNTGGRSPEELDTLLEDALVLRDGEAVARLFEESGLLLGAGHPVSRGHGAIAEVVAQLSLQAGYVAGSREILQSQDIALMVGDGAISVARRSPDRSWRFAIALLGPGSPLSGVASQRTAASDI